MTIIVGRILVNMSIVTCQVDYWGNSWGNVRSLRGHGEKYILWR